MRLLSYNILDGGKGRADPLAEVIAAQRADIVALVEADDPAVVARIAARLRMDSITAEGHKHSVALLSRWPIVNSVNHALLNKNLTKCLLEATVRDPRGEELPISVVHLHAQAKNKDDEIRQREVAAILDICGDHRQNNLPHLLVGDFNADSPLQQIDPGGCKPETREAWYANGGDLPRGAARMLLSAGYIDTMHACRPGEAARLGSFSTRNSGQRVDYIFAFGFKARLKNAWIEQDRLAQYASDHFPVGVEIE